MDLEYIIFIQAGADKVFQTLTEDKSVAQLYYGSRLEGEKKPGGCIVYRGPGVEGENTEHILGEVISYIPGREFSHSCRVGIAYGEEHTGFESQVSYTMEEIHPGLCKLRVYHNHWQKGDPSYENTKAGWWLFISSLKSLVETGRPIMLTAVAHN